MIVDSLSSENRDLKTSVNKLNEEMLNASSANNKCQQEIKSLKNPEKDENEYFLYSNGFFSMKINNIKFLIFRVLWFNI